MKKRERKYLVITAEMGFGRNIRSRIDTLTRGQVRDWVIFNTAEHEPMREEEQHAEEA